MRPSIASITPTANDYFARLLQLALDQTIDSYGPYLLRRPSGRWVGNRLRAALGEGTVHVVWFTNFAEAERKLLKMGRCPCAQS